MEVVIRRSKEAFQQKSEGEEITIILVARLNPENLKERAISFRAILFRPFCDSKIVNLEDFERLNLKHNIPKATFRKNFILWKWHPSTESDLAMQFEVTD